MEVEVRSYRLHEVTGYAIIMNPMKGKAKVIKVRKITLITLKRLIIIVT